VTGLKIFGTLGMRTLGHIVPASDGIVRAYRAAVPRIGVVPKNAIVTLGDRRTFRVFRTPAECHVRSTDFLIYYFGMVDGRETRAFSRLVEPRDICVDAGANSGWYTLLFSELTGLNGEVHAFEPDPRAFAQLRDNVALSRSIVRLNNVALGRSSGTMQLYTAYNTQLSSLHPISPDLLPHQAEISAPGGRCRVPVTTLDAYAGMAGLERIDVIKLDVEGSEFDVLRGGERVIRMGMVPPVLFLELNPGAGRQAGVSVHEMVAWLDAKVGYHFYRATALGRLVEFRSARDLLAEVDGLPPGRVLNVFCLVPSCHARRLARASLLQRRWSRG
jgi:FkbM family methyltransferase